MAKKCLIKKEDDLLDGNPLLEDPEYLGWLFRPEFRGFRQIPANSGKVQKGTPADTEFAHGIPETSVKYSGYFTGCRLCTRLLAWYKVYRLQATTDVSAPHGIQYNVGAWEHLL
jgi:hypothetical protein